MPLDNLTEKLNQIKLKLIKYMGTKDINKIKGYLSQLETVEHIDMDILKTTEIVDCLKTLKKNQDPNYSQQAGAIIAKWKALVYHKSAEEGGQSAPSKEKPVTNREKESKPSKMDESQSKSSINKSTSNGNLLPNRASLNGSIGEKRPAMDQNDQNKEAKKHKLSLNDYQRVKNGTPNDEPYNPWENAKNLKDFNLTKEKQHDNKPNASSSNLMVPKPTMKLSDILPISSISSTLSSGASHNGNGALTANRTQTNEDLLSNIFSSKHSKRMLYTGRRNHDESAEVPKLFDLCQNVLINSLDDLHTKISNYNYAKEFPLVIDPIKPVLERANAKQLETIEYFNPHFLTDTDYMWKRICEQVFKGVKEYDREEDENWREYYFRKFDEREAKFQRAREAVSRLQASKPKERVTQMATVKFVSSGSRSSSSVTLKPSEASNKLKTTSSSSAAPVRRIVHDTPIRKQVIQTISNGRKPVNSGPVVSKGMKKVQKMFKNIRR